MTLSPQLRFEIEKLASLTGLKEANIQSVEPICGGSISRAFRVIVGKKSYFLKVNHRIYKAMFAAEIVGLACIANTAAVATPKIMGMVEDDLVCGLMLSWVDEAAPSTRGCSELGVQLAQMHRHSAGQFGFSSDNFIGTLPQSNGFDTSWTGFFVNNRLQPQIDQASDLIPKLLRRQLDGLISRMGQFETGEKPALVHGDLWSGNVLMDQNDRPVIIDPSVYYGNREVDLAMTRLFGGFSMGFYDAYQAEFPLCEGWEERIRVWNLYPILVHLNLFGEGYLPQLKNSLMFFD
jgi:protein-ribulosamine 3-kinase